MKILIAGDCVVSQKYTVENINKDILHIFNSSDYNILNLEAPLTNSTKKIVKTGPHLKANIESTKEIFSALRIDLVTLANNHILDYDEKGVLETLAFCEANDIATVGAGKDRQSAAKPYVLESRNGRIAILNIAENEWASATANSAGAHGMDLIDNVKQIQEAKANNEFVFVIVHGGHEYYNLPSPRIQKQYRFYIDNGADLVVGHHTHCISGFEEYQGKPIYYSLGNFLFTKPSVYEDWYKGIVLEVEIQERKLKTNIQIVTQRKDNFGLVFLKEADYVETISIIESYNKIIRSESELNIKWKEFANSKFKTYLNYLSPLRFVKNRYLRAVLTKLGVNPISKSGMALVLNLMRCEAHTELSKEIIESYLDRK